MNAVHKVDSFTPTEEDMASARVVIALLQQANVNANLREVITTMLEKIAEGDSVAILSKNKEYSTSEAAEFLHVSKTFLLKVIDLGELPCRRVGKHRRIRAQDLYAYQAHLEADRTKALTKLYKLSETYESEE